MWSYLYFIIHLKTKDQTDFNGTESYIYEKLDNDDIQWIPLHRAIVLDKKNMQEDEHDLVLDQFGKLQQLAGALESQAGHLAQQHKK